MDAVFDFPDLSLGTSAVGWGIHDNGIVMISPADLTFRKLYAVIYDPADGGVFQAACLGVFFGPAHHAFGSVYMGDGSSGCRRRQGGAAGVGEEIQNFYGPSGIPDLIPEPVPVCRLFREKPCVLKAEGF